jgi:hypothetical protein
MNGWMDVGMEVEGGAGRIHITFDQNHHITDRTGISGKEEVSERIQRLVTNL